jgi:hypothetical protein
MGPHRAVKVGANGADLERMIGGDAVSTLYGFADYTGLDNAAICEVQPLEAMAGRAQRLSEDLLANRLRGPPSATGSDSADARHP